LCYTGEEVTRNCADIVVYEVQDHGKETRRQYLPLMELAHREDPDGRRRKGIRENGIGRVSVTTTPRRATT
jgi:hypothetical protein